MRHNTDWNKNIILPNKKFLQGRWECNMSNSEYHFDETTQDQPGDWFKILGNVGDMFNQEVQDITNAVDRFIKYEENTEDLAFTAPNYDKLSGTLKSITSKAFTDSSTPFYELKKLQKMFSIEAHSVEGIAQSTRLVIQPPGGMYRIHVDDELWKIHPQDPSRVVRLTIMLQDWKPGQFFMYGNLIYDNWKAGDVHIFDWPNAPHATANASAFYRLTMQITGLKTEKTEQIIKNGLPNG